MYFEHHFERQPFFNFLQLGFKVCFKFIWLDMELFSLYSLEVTCLENNSEPGHYFENQYIRYHYHGTTGYVHQRHNVSVFIAVFL